MKKSKKNWGLIVDLEVKKNLSGFNSKCTLPTTDFFGKNS